MSRNPGGTAGGRGSPTGARNPSSAVRKNKAPGSSLYLTRPCTSKVTDATPTIPKMMCPNTLAGNFS